MKLQHFFLEGGGGGGGGEGNSPSPTRGNTTCLLLVTRKWKLQHLALVDYASNNFGTNRYFSEHQELCWHNTYR